MAGWTEIDSITLGSPAAAVTFSSGLTAYKFFRLTVYAGASGGASNVLLRFNAETTNYTSQEVTATGTTVAGARVTDAGIEINGLSMAQDNWGSYSVIIARPSTGVKPQVIANGGNDASPELGLIGAEWDNTADTISSISLVPSANSFAAGTSILLEGLAF